MKLIQFLGNSLNDIKSFPDAARQRAGFELWLVQKGKDPSDWKMMKAVGEGVREIRIQDQTGAYRMMYTANIGDRILVLHAFTKTSRKTARSDIEIASRRLKQWKNSQ